MTTGKATNPQFNFAPASCWRFRAFDLWVFGKVLGGCKNFKMCVAYGVCVDEVLTDCVIKRKLEELSVARP